MRLWADGLHLGIRQEEHKPRLAAMIRVRAGGTLTKQ